MDNELVSIVIPIYNVEKYIEKCLDSVIKQTYKNIEIILVDDGSPDNCGKICDSYANNDKRIQVIHKENGGLSDARNVGIERANGKYITFVDSDDYIELDYIEYLYTLIKKYNTKISLCKVNVVYNEKDTNLQRDKNNEIDYKWTKVQTLEDILYAKNFDVSAYAKMYLTEDFKNIRYPKGKLFEDNDTTYKLIDKNDYVAVGFEKKYNYIIRNNSITRANFKKEQLYLIEASDNMCSYLSKYEQLKKATYRKKFWARISTFNRMINSNERNYAAEKKLRKEILKYKKVLLDSKSSFRDKISIILLSFGTDNYKRIWNFYKKNRK